MGAEALSLFNEFCKEENLDYSSRDFNVKVGVASLGAIELSGLVIPGVILIGIIFVAGAGGGFSFNYKTDVSAKIESDGIIEKVRNFLTTKSNIRTKKKLLEDHMKNLQIKDPQELIDLLNQLDKK
jgi:restriction system protein